MLDELAPTQKRRVQSADSVAYRAEQRTMAPFRMRIGDLQREAAFAIARANFSKTPGHGVNEATFATIRAAAAKLSRDIEGAAPSSGIGPADNCRRALQVVLDRLDGTAP